MDPRVSLACSIVLFCFAGSFAGVFAYAAVMMVRYTPLYRPMHCVHLKGQLAALPRSGGPLELRGRFERRCDNQNLYTVHLEEATSDVYIRVNSSLMLVGSGRHGRSAFPSAGHGESKNVIQLSLPVEVHQSLANQSLVVVMTTTMKYRGELHFMSWHIPAYDDFHQACGFQYAMASGVAGPLTCGPSAERLQPLPPGADAPQQVMLMNRYHRSLEEKKKDFIFGVTLVVSASLTVVALMLGCRHERLRRRGKAPGEPSPRNWPRGRHGSGVGLTEAGPGGSFASSSSSAV